MKQQVEVPHFEKTEMSEGWSHTMRRAMTEAQGDNERVTKSFHCDLEDWHDVLKQIIGDLLTKQKRLELNYRRFRREEWEETGKYSQRATLGRMRYKEGRAAFGLAQVLIQARLGFVGRLLRDQNREYSEGSDSPFKQLVEKVDLIVRELVA